MAGWCNVADECHTADYPDVSTCHLSSQLPLFSIGLTLEKEEEDASDSEESVFSGLEESGSDSDDEEDLAVIDGPLEISSGAESPEKEDVQVAILTGVSRNSVTGFSL